MEIDRGFLRQVVPVSGTVSLKNSNDEHVDVLDEIMLQAWESCGEVVLVPAGLKPGATGTAAFFRH